MRPLTALATVGEAVVALVGGSLPLMARGLLETDMRTVAGGLANTTATMRQMACQDLAPLTSQGAPTDIAFMVAKVRRFARGWRAGTG
jgi:hypothetical protein